MMKLCTISLLLIVAGVFSATKTFACRCAQPTAARALNSTSDVFTGTILRKQKALDKNVSQTASLVSVDRIIKGCSLKTTDRIIVTTSSSSASCGVKYVVGESYYFTGDVEVLDPKLILTTYGLKFNVPINSTMIASSCQFNKLRGAVARRDRNMFSTYGRNKNVCFVKCTMGTDCPNQDYYCDSDNGTCQLFNGKCPPDMLPALCAADPCSVTEPCNEQSVKCTTNYCGGCYPIFTDTNRTQICKG